MATKYQVIHPKRASIVQSRVIYDDGLLWIEGFSRDKLIVARLRFDEVLLTRIADESSRLRLMNELGGISELVLEDESSELLRWLTVEGLHTRDIRSARHFLVFVGEEIIDVVAFGEPALE